MRGSSVPLGFTPLKSFHLDTALDASAIVALRNRRLTGHTELVRSMALSEWQYRLALDLLGDLIPDLTETRPLSIIEFGAGSGPLFERLKGALPAGGLRYIAVGSAEEAKRFALLHESDSVPYIYTHHVELPLDGDEVVVLNHNQAIRYGQSPNIDWLDLACRLKGPAVMPLRVALGEDESRLTVNGHVVHLAGLENARAVLRNTNRSWRVRLLRGFDDGFFLPPEGTPTSPDAVNRKLRSTGLCIAILAPRRLHRDRFEAA